MKALLTLCLTGLRESSLHKEILFLLRQLFITDLEVSSKKLVSEEGETHSISGGDGPDTSLSS